MATDSPTVGLVKSAGRARMGRWILLVEDNEEDIVLFKAALRKARVANPLNVVKDGEEAIKYLSGVDPYSDRKIHPIPILLLLDLRLPKISGFEVLEWIREQPALNDLTVVIMSGSADAPNVKIAHELRANSYLLKPRNFDQLVELMKRINVRWLRLGNVPEVRPQTSRRISPP